jgi:hypothetical protein
MSFDSSLLDLTLTDLLPSPKITSSPLSDTNHPIKRPHNAYNLYFIERLQIEKVFHPNLTGNEISQLIGKTWSEMDEEGRRPYQERARELHEKFKEDYPDYHYQKSKNKEKVVECTLPPQKLLETSLKNLFDFLGSQLMVKMIPQNQELMENALRMMQNAVSGDGIED